MERPPGVRANRIPTHSTSSMITNGELGVALALKVGLDWQRRIVGGTLLVIRTLCRPRFTGTGETSGWRGPGAGIPETSATPSNERLQRREHGVALGEPYYEFHSCLAGFASSSGV